jgi:hypothetical protein
MTETKAKRRKLPNRALPEKKVGSFAIGVSTNDYWLITALAQSKGINRTAMLETIVAHYAQTVLSKI